MRRPALSIAVAVALVISVTTVGVVAPPPPQADAAGTPPACPWTNTWQRRCNRYTSDGFLGSIGLLGDSVLLGSADGMSNPGLPAMLSGAGWGPINLVATQGMKTRWTTDNSVSGQYWVKRWHDYGFHPDVIAVNLGANHLGSWSSPTCTPSNTAPCTTQINYLLDHLAAYHPTARIWWAKVNHEPFGKGNGYSLGMLGWNAALDQAAASRPNLVLWDWPSALLNANPPILTDSPRIHPSSGVQYVKRSTLMRDHIGLMMPWSRRVGPSAPLPAGNGEAAAYEPVEPEVIFDSTTSPTPVLPASTTSVIDLDGVVPPGTAAVNVTLVASGATRDGWAAAWRCGDDRPLIASINFTVGTTRAAQAQVPVSDDLTICLFNHAPTGLTIYLGGYFSTAASTRFTPITPQRGLDTRESARAVDLVVNVPEAASVATTVTVTGPSTGGVVSFRSCTGGGIDIPVLAYSANEMIGGAAFAKVSPGNQICIHIAPTGGEGAPLPEVIVDVTGTFRTDGQLEYVPAVPTRLLDTRYATGGWSGMHGSRQTIDVVAVPAGAKAVTGTLVIVQPLAGSFLTAFACGLSLPPTASVNAWAGQILANSVTVGVNPANSTLCILAHRRTHNVFDLAGWWVDALPG